MTLYEFERGKDASEQETLWTLGEMKDSGQLDATWTEIAEYMNHNYRENEDDYCGESGYRRRYTCAKEFRETVFAENKSDKSTQEQIRELMEERQRLRDERMQYGKYIRDNARLKAWMDDMDAAISEIGKSRYEFKLTTPQVCSVKEMLVLLGDWHIGLNFKSEFGYFNLEAAKERLSYLAGYIVRKQREYKCGAINVACLGDMISGIIKTSVMAANRESAVEQATLAAEMLTDFIYVLTQNFGEVNFVSVAGNHSRLNPIKDESVKNDRLDDIVAWYVKAALKHIPNFKPRMVVDNTAAELGICGRLYYFVHGDHDSISQDGISKLSFMMGSIPDAVCVGHKHYPIMTEINGVTVVQNGALCGAGDNYTVENRLSGRPSQTVMICSKDGIENYWPVRLDY